MTTIQIQNIPIDDIIPYKNNPRKNDKAVPALINSINEYGFLVPLLIDRNHVVIAGHTRLKAAKQLGLTELPCIVADDLTPAQVKAYRLMDNKAAEKSHWDETLLAQEFQSLISEGYDLTKTAFETFEIESITFQSTLLGWGETESEDGDGANDNPYAPTVGASAVGDAPIQSGARDIDPAPDETYTVIICCRTDEEQAAVRELLHITNDKQQRYNMSDLQKLQEAAQTNA